MSFKKRNLFAVQTVITRFYSRAFFRTKLHTLLTNQNPYSHITITTRLSQTDWSATNSTQDQPTKVAVALTENVSTWQEHWLVNPIQRCPK